MKDSEKSAFVSLMTGVAELHNKKLSTHLLNIYWLALEKYSLNEIKSALNHHAVNPDNGQFMPKPADIVRYLEGSTETQGMKAWTKVQKTMKQIGTYETVVFDDYIIHVVIHDMGGWINLCRTKEDELPFRAREFEKRYARYIVNKPNTYPKQLMGIFDAENIKEGFSPQSPVLIGNKNQAKQIYLNGEGSTQSKEGYVVLSLSSLLENPLPKKIISSNKKEKS